MAPFSMWETILIGALALLVIFWFRPGIRAAFAQSRQAEAHWADVLIPLALVALFVFFLILVS
ncbi:MAG TPA: hypothetical protein VLU73_04330 [Methylococcaceae bacterium]|jgi:hypothetical protein|nr:hypothetical protein [Methylococcaceae bacterium]